MGWGQWLRRTHRKGPKPPAPHPSAVSPQIRDRNRWRTLDWNAPRNPTPRGTALAWVSALRGASSGAGFSAAFPPPLDAEAPFRLLFFFFCFFKTASLSPPTGCALEAASLHAGCPEQRQAGWDPTAGGLGAPGSGRRSRGLRGARAGPGPAAAGVSRAGCPRAWRKGGGAARGSRGAAGGRRPRHPRLLSAPLTAMRRGRRRKRRRAGVRGRLRSSGNAPAAQRSAGPGGRGAETRGQALHVAGGPRREGRRPDRGRRPPRLRSQGSTRQVRTREAAPRCEQRPRAGGPGAGAAPTLQRQDRGTCGGQST